MAGEATNADVNASEEITTDIFSDEVEDTTAEDSSSEETKPEVEADAEEPAEETETKDEEAESEEQAEEESTEDQDTETEQPKKDAEARKAELNAEIREKVATRNALRQEIAELNAKVYQPVTAEELVAEGVDPKDAEIEALKQSQQVSEFNNYVADLNSNLATESAQILHDFPEFDPQQPETFNKELSARAKNLYEKVAQIKRDPKTGLIYDANVLPYTIYQELALAAREGAKTGQVRAQKSTDKMLEAAEVTTSSAPKQPKVDPLEELWSS